MGLAHFLEHMLFLGTDKYPEADYDIWLGKNAGYSNAYTDQMLTNYFFESSNEALEEAIDRFSQFFISARFNQDLTEREMNAVNSEHQKNLQSDGWRQWQLFKSSCKQDHPFNRYKKNKHRRVNRKPFYVERVNG